jgi:MFS family permease
MYPLDPKPLQGLQQGRWSGVGPNVYFLGLTSLLTDISSEMVTSILPIYLVFALGLSPLQFGIVDGLSQAVAALARLGSGLLADRWRNNREVAAAGYALSAVSKLLLLAAGSAWLQLSSAIMLDRIGKGMRTSPRDALISLSSTPQRLGLAFGVHRAMDTFGALLGPLVAFGILSLLVNAFDLVFVASFFFAVVGIATLLCFVKNVSSDGAPASARRPMLVDVAQLFKGRHFRMIVLAGSVLGLVTVADSFFFLLLQRKMSMQAASFPLLYVATAAVYMLLAIPAGRLGDRFGRGRVFLIGHALLVLACVNLLLSGDGLPGGLLSLGLLGAYYACTDGVLMAAASAFLPKELRATGLAMLATAIGMSRMVASLMFGAIWELQSADVAIGAFAAGLVVAMLVTARPLMRLAAVQ